MNTSEFLTITNLIVPDRTALIFEDTRTTFTELQDRVNMLANAMSDMGISKGSRVAFMHVNTNQAIEIYFATAQLDAIYVPINFRSKEDELNQMLEISKPDLLFIGNRYLSLTDTLLNKETLKESQLITLDSGVTSKFKYYEDILTNQTSDQIHFPEDDDSDTTVIMFTAGTTGTPKGVMLSHNSFSSYLLSTVSPADPDINETNLITVPFYHIAGLQAALAAIYGGRTMAIMRQFDPLDWLKTAEANKANRAMLVPTMLKRIIDHPNFQDFDLSDMSVITYGAAPMPLDVIRRSITSFPNTMFINAFGQTETASTITMLPPEDHILDGSQTDIEIKLKRLTSIGKPLDDIEILIVSEDGNPVDTGEIGEIVARGDRLMTGYWNQESATSETIKSGWLYTGDLAYQDQDGYIFLSGRAKDFIKRGGEMISPEEVEQVLQSHPQVSDAAIIGTPDEEWGEEVVAVIVTEGPPPSADNLIEHCGEHLASYKKPKYLYFIDELPRNAMGKVLKRDLREQYS